jgi:ankyrin repeat protein
MQNTIIELIKNKNIKDLISLIKKDNDINLNVKDSNYNYFIYYVILYNEEELLDLILKRNIRLDILDTDGRNMLYVPIKFSYNKMLIKLIEKDSQNIGLPIIDIKDKLGLTALHYSIIFNNYEAYKILLKKSNLFINNNQNLNAFHICIQYNRIQFFLDILEGIPELDIVTTNNENLLQYSILFERYDFIQYILKKKININNYDNTNGLTALHQSIIKNKIELVQILINNGSNINAQDYYGNTPLHYAISEENRDMISLLLKYNPNLNLTNIDGNTPLHAYLNTSYLEKEILQLLIPKTDLNIQNNNGLTCLKIIIDLYITDNYIEILKKKELNFFIQDNNGEDMSSSLNDEHILNLAIDSYYNMIKEKEDKLILDWEIWCGKDLVEKLKILDIKHTQPILICKEKIKEVILKEKRSLPKFSNYDLSLDNGIFVNTCYYTGVPLDILFGILFLNKTFSKDGFQLILDYPLTVNQPLENYYQKIGIDYPFKLEFSNCEILWSFQKIFFPSYFDNEFEKAIKDNYIKYIAIPLGIELTNGSHANIIFIDKKNKTIERFEPNGSHQPIGLNYNPELLDDILSNKFSEYEYKYFKPNDFLPSIGFQLLENMEESKCKRLGDPNGFCGVWCIWWVYHRIKNIKIDNISLVNYLIKNIKLENKSFKNIIRNFSYYITELRDNTLKKYDIDINDWMVNSVDKEIIDSLEKEIFKIIKL